MRAQDGDVARDRHDNSESQLNGTSRQKGRGKVNGWHIMADRETDTRTYPYMGKRRMQHGRCRHNLKKAANGKRANAYATIRTQSHNELRNEMCNETRTRTLTDAQVRSTMCNGAKTRSERRGETHKGPLDDGYIHAHRENTRPIPLANSH